MTVNAQTQSIFDQDHYKKHIEARGKLIQRLVPDLKLATPLATALDAGCGVGFFASLLQECGLEVHAFDGREKNVEEARKRYPHVDFLHGDIEDKSILQLGEHDLVLCFGLLYHLENPLRAIRNLRALSRKLLLLETMCLPGDEPTALLLTEPNADDQSLTDLAFYPTEGCIVKMLYRSGFTSVYRVADLPDHDDFRNTAEHTRRRTVIVASVEPANVRGLILIQEPQEPNNPWQKFSPRSRRFKRYLASPGKLKYSILAKDLQRRFPSIPIPIRLPFGAWWLVRSDHIGQPIIDGKFEQAEVSFVRKFIQPGMTVLDIGAHHGFYTLLASHCVGSTGRVFSFEPSPRERNALRKHVRLNHCLNVQIEECALGNENKLSQFHVVNGDQTGCNSLRPPVITSTTSPIAVKVERLDDWLKTNQFNRVDFIKLDVEGGELNVFKGAEDLLERQPRPVILVEVQDVRTLPWGYRANEIISHLSEKGFRWFRLLPDGSIQHLNLEESSFDGNYIAFPSESLSSAIRLLGDS